MLSVYISKAYKHVLKAYHYSTEEVNIDFAISLRWHSVLASPQLSHMF